jgi:ribosomal protein L24
METKKCSKCGQTKPTSDFHKDSHHKDGLTSHCKVCCAISRKSYRSNNPVMCWCIDTIHSHKTKHTVLFNPKELYEVAKNTNKCPICGCNLIYGYNKKRKLRMNSPSLDRINNESTMTLDNVMIMCYDCNSTKRSRTLDEFIDYSRTVAKLKKSDEA